MPEEARTLKVLPSSPAFAPPSFPYPVDRQTALYTASAHPPLLNRYGFLFNQCKCFSFHQFVKPLASRLPPELSIGLRPVALLRYWLSLSCSVGGRVSSSSSLSSERFLGCLGERTRL